ncbi:MAG: hypothetical protein LBU81_00115 [Methanosarcinales archaeon]|jgi:hypothetical protein|nr:hypothetical protein [Methanosarcinales archaeon]
MTTEKLTQGYLKELLEEILEAFDSEEPETWEWYVELFPDELCETEGYYIHDITGEYGDECDRYCPENILAVEAIKHPELHPLMAQLLEKITAFNAEHDTMWVSEEEQAGNSIARELCKYDKKYLPLYYEFIKTNDLDHAVYQPNDLDEVYEKWEYSPEIMPLLLYMTENCQRSLDYGGLAEGICKTKEDAQKYLDAMAVYFDDQWHFETADSAEFDDAETLDMMLSPLFKTLFELDGTQMARFVLAYNNSMANGEKPTIEQLLAAA